MQHMHDGLLERLLARTTRDETTGCLRWQGAKNLNGYGRVRFNGRLALVHRVVCELAHGLIPDGYVVDHVHARGCRHVDCINPDHLEAVTWRENMLRSSHPKMVTARTKTCAKGHRITGKNRRPDKNGRGVVGYRCRRCAIERRRADRAKARA